MLASALGITIIATVYVGVDEPASANKTVNPLPTADHNSINLSHERILDPGLALAQRELSEVSNDIFTIDKPIIQKPAVEPPATVLVPPKTEFIPPQIAPPSPPSSPFNYLGKLSEAGRYTIFLMANGRNYAVKTGDTIAQVYRIDEISPPVLTFTYIPLNTRQTMFIGEAN